MEQQLKCVLLLSLKEMALRRVAVHFCNGSDIPAPKFRSVVLDFKEWREAVEDKIKNKVLKLELPASLAKQMIDRIKPMSLEVKAWMRNHRHFLRNLNNEISLPDSMKLYWTTAGTINYKRSAVELVRCDSLDEEKRYELACNYCMEDYILLYWEELPEEKKRKYCDDENPWPDLSYCWPHILKREHSKLYYLLRRPNRNLTSFNQWAFEHSARNFRKTAAGYFFQKLTHEEREASLKRAAVDVITESDAYSPCEKRSHVLSFLLSEMTSEQQMETMKAHPVHVFACFLHWPLQDLILDNAGLLWTSIPPSSYIELVKMIVHEYECQRICFPLMFKEFFTGSPPDFKNCFLEADEYGFSPACSFLSAFFDYEDSESIQVMFRNLGAADRVKFVFQKGVLRLFRNFMLCAECPMVGVCLREAALSKEEKGRLKNEFKGYLEGRGESVNGKFERFFELLHETDASFDKQEKKSEA